MKLLMKSMFHKEMTSKSIEFNQSDKNSVLMGKPIFFIFSIYKKNYNFIHFNYNNI